MRLALIAPLVAPIKEPHCGGAQAFLADLARGMRDRGHEVHLFAASGSRVSGVHVVDVGVDHRSVVATLYRAGDTHDQDSAAAAAAFAAVYAATRDGGYDLVHNHAFDAPAIALAEGDRAPTLHTLHLPPAPAVAAALEDALHGEAPPRIACVSESQARAWRAHVPVEALLPPFVPTRSISFAATAQGGALFAGRLSPEKGAAQAIDIARAAGLAIEVFGEPYDARYAREQIEPRGRLSGVEIRGGVERRALWAAMARARVVLCPAYWEEPFGMAAAEAQACGTPVVGFERGALAQVVVDGVTGVLVAPDDLDAAVEAVRGIESISRPRCRLHAERELDLELTLDAHECLYERLTDGARSALGG